MAKEILDIYIEQGYSFDFDLDYNTYDGQDLEDVNDVYFKNKSIGVKQFSVIDNSLYLTLTKTDTDKLLTNLETYVVYAKDKLTGIDYKLISGRIHLDMEGK